jgi:prevent-host-death family protein
MGRAHFSLDEERLRRVRREAERLGISVSEFCRRAVERALAGTGGPGGPRMRFAGCARSGDAAASRSVDRVAHQRARGMVFAPQEGAMRQVSVDDARERLPELVEAANRGEEVIITAGGTLRARLVSVPREAAGPRFGSAAGQIEMAEDFDEPLPDFRDYLP